MPTISGKSDLTDRERAILAQHQGVIARSVPDHAAPLVEQQASFFLHRGRKTIDIVSKRAEKYLVYAKGVFRSRGMPEELAYLAIVESGYNPKARSQAGAAGAWQFMPYTGMKFGLQQDSWEDERLDVYSATVAAAEYLKKLYGQFGDWPTAIAAYNAGEGKMGRACKAAGKRTFFGVLTRNESLDEKTRLREETRQYVPRFLAIAAIMENLEELGFAPINPDAAPQVSKVRLAPATSLKAMAGACDMSWNEFRDYNPHFLKDVTHSTHKTNAYVPERATARAVAFASNPVRASKT
ncbi:MAG: lytic transglycosylase domain-containing protein, partial [Desulfovibrionaceae bacterium]|nr:lytic transglycosylase domain-containing protein [Desulfovibrionaceae bacterium]